MVAIKIYPPTQDSMRKTEEFKRKSKEFLMEEERARADYIKRNGLTPEEEYMINYYPDHAFTDID